MKGLEHLGWSREGSGGSYQCLEIPEGRDAEDRARLFSVVPSGRTESDGHKMKHGRVPLNIRKHFFHWGWRSIGTGCPETLWSLHPWRYSKAVWTWSWVTGCRWSCLSSGVGPDDLQKSLPTSSILWFSSFPVRMENVGFVFNSMYSRQDHCM